MLFNILSLIIGGLGLGSLIIFFVQRYDNKKRLEALTQENTEDIKELHKTVDLVKDMAMGSLYDRTRYVAQEYIKRGYITPGEYNDWIKYLYNPYKANEGDGAIDKMKVEIDKLYYDASKT